MQHHIANTAAGPVQGVFVRGVYRFLDIPYAAPPVGSNRFSAPRSHDPWQSVRDAGNPGPNSPHSIDSSTDLDIAPLIGEGWHRGDDFLTVNVWTSDPDAIQLPVMVFIHGGGWVAGANYADVIDGTEFARSGIVYMAINYRLGVEGFVPVEGAPTNLGLRDQLFALRWVRDNAHAFGGDAANITVFGESAGAMSIADLIASPQATGLFQRAILESGHGSMVRPIPVARRLTQRLADILKIPPDLAGFRSRSPEQCLVALKQVQLPDSQLDLRNADGREPAFGLSRFLPVYGDDVLPDPPLIALANGVGAGIQLLIGTNTEEMNLYFVPTKLRDTITAQQAEHVVGFCEPNAREILAAYGMGQRHVKAGDAFTEALTDLVFRLPARHYAVAHLGSTHFYEFGWRSPAFDGRLGACHALELPFVFNTLDCCSGSRGFVGLRPPQALADHVHKLWVEFAKDGTLPWSPYTGETRQVYRLEQQAATTDATIPASRYWP